MKIKLITLPLILLISISAISTAQDMGGALQDRTNNNNIRFGMPDDIKGQLDQFFNSMVKKEYKKGLESLLLNSPISKKDDDFANILRQIGKAIDLYGDLKAYEIVDYKAAGTSFYKVKIIGLHQKYPTRWEINFYRSPDMGLIVSNFKFDDIAEIYLD